MNRTCRRWTSFALPAALCLFLATACGRKQQHPAASSAPGSTFGDLFIAASIGDASYLNPVLASDTASFDIIGLVYNGLVKYDKDLKLVGDLADSWDVTDNGLTIRST